MKPDVSKVGHVRVIAVILGICLLSPAIALGGGTGTTACLDGSPTIPLEQFRTISGQGTFEMWPPNFKPADPIGQALPANRDSATFNGFQRPGRAGGLELFYESDIVGNNLFIAYNAGFQIWNIGGAFASAPQFLSSRDGWANEFHEFEETQTEFYFLIWDIAAINPPTNSQTLVAVAADSASVGLTIWDAASKTNPSQLYQDTSKTGIQVVAANIGGRSYAFLGGSNGVHVYDMTRAREIGPCFESTAGAANLCGGNTNPVWRGRMEPWPWMRARYLDVLSTTIGGQPRHFLAVSDSFGTPLEVELREITNAASLPPASVAIRDGLDTRSSGVDLFQINDSYYLGVTDLNDVAIYDVTNCLASTTGCNLSNPRVSFPTGISDFSYVQFSESNGRPFLHKGFHNLCSRPPTSSEPYMEYLLDLNELDSGGTVVNVIGDEYFDPNHSGPQRRINYWTASYDQSTGGFSSYAPHGGRFNGRYFYRGNQTSFDVHEFTGDIPITASIQPTTNDRWLSSSDSQPEWVNLSGACSTGAGTGWQWSATNAAGTPGADPNPIVEPLGGNLARVRRNLCAADNYPASVCPSATLNAEADVACDGTPTNSNELPLTLADPRPFFTALDIVEAPQNPGPPPEYPVCTTLNFRALNGVVNEIGGKALTSFGWTVTPTAGGDPLSCDVAGAGTGLSCNESQLVWDTQGIELGDPDSIFADGFESGDTTAWTAKASEGAVTSGATFDVLLTATNEHGSIQRTTQLMITPLEDLVFTGQGFTIPAPPGDGLYDFTATALSATLYRWEFQQDASLPGDAGCTLVTPCEIRTTTSPTIQYQWPAGNTNGANYDVALEISNCDTSVAPISVTRTVNNVTVITDTPPEITAFRVVTVGTPCSCFAGQCICPPGVAQFTVDIDGLCDDLSITWGDGNTSNGLSCDSPIYSHNYLNEGTFDLEAEACLGAQCDTQSNLTNISPTFPIPLTIEE